MRVVALRALAACGLTCSDGNPGRNIGAGGPDVERFLFIGNLDEAAAALLLLNCLAYFGFDLRRFFGRNEDTAREQG